jgi:hypothetical protein
VCDTWGKISGVFYLKNITFAYTLIIMVTISFTTAINLNTNQLQVTDTTNYQGQGIPSANVVGILSISNATGVIYQGVWNRPDINPSVSPLSTLVNMPTTNGFITPGVYTVTYTINYGITQYSATNTYTYTFIVPAIDITQEVDGYASTFSSTDDTNYGSPVSMTYLQTVTPPAGSGLSIQTSSSPSIPIEYPANIYTGLYQSVVTATLEYVETDGLILNLVLSNASIPTQITAYSIDTLAIMNAVESFRLNYYGTLGSNKGAANQMASSINIISLAFVAYQLAVSNNDTLLAYQEMVNIYQQLNSYIIPPTTSQMIVPFVI